jgi:D-aspartate ligase
MKIIEKEFIAVLLGSDINTYSMARAFHEEYKIKSVVIGKYYTGPSFESKITEFYADKNLDEPKIFVKKLNEIAEKYKDKKIILLACGDNYIRQVIENKKKLAKNFIIPYIELSLMEKLIKKEEFYKMCEKYNIDYPNTLIYNKKMGHKFKHNFKYPMILKPSNSVDYFAHEFPGQYKVYTIESEEELHKVIDDIYNAGYTDTLILQDFIPGDDTNMYVMTTYSDKFGKVKLMSLGHTMLEEHTPHGIGNHAVIINEYNEELSLKIKKFLEDIHFVGFANFDIKYDPRDKKFKLFEINVRQGRSNFYVTGAGYNLAKYITEDYIYNKDLGFTIANNEHLWSMIPIKIAYEYVSNEDYIKKMKKLIKDKKFVNPLYYRGDNKIKRILRLKNADKKQFSKYKNFMKK